jgi:hypothetical protein
MPLRYGWRRAARRREGRRNQCAERCDQSRRIRVHEALAFVGVYATGAGCALCTRSRAHSLRMCSVSPRVSVYSFVVRLRSVWLGVCVVRKGVGGAQWCFSSLRVRPARVVAPHDTTHRANMRLRINNALHDARRRNGIHHEGRGRRRTCDQLSGGARYPRAPPIGHLRTAPDNVQRRSNERRRKGTMGRGKNRTHHWSNQG